MSHIPASAMPHAKPQGDDAPNAAAPKPDTVPPHPSADAPRDHPEGLVRGKPPVLALLAAGALTIGGIVAAVALNRPAAPRKAPKGKRKAKGRKPHADA